MKFTIPLLTLIILLAACQPTGEPTDTLPTLAVLPNASATASTTPTEEVVSEVTPEATAEATISADESSTPAALPSETAEPTATLTRTPRPTTPTPTVEPTLAAIGTATQAILEAPRYSTFTPAPAGSNDQGIANIVADVTIDESQFQEEIDRNILAYPSMQSARIDFVPGAINVEMTTVDDNFATITGTVIITVTLEGELATITISDIRTEQVNTPQSYIDVAITDTFKMMVDTLDQIVKRRVGPQQKLKSIALTDTDILVTLVVPKTG